MTDKEVQQPCIGQCGQVSEYFVRHQMETASPRTQRKTCLYYHRTKVGISSDPTTHCGANLAQKTTKHKNIPLPFDHLTMLAHYLNLIATGISLISLLIVTYGTVVATIAFIRNEIGRANGTYSGLNIRRLRASFGTYLLLGLEFLIASDILKTVLEPGLNELAILGGIVVLRTVLSIFLNREIRDLQTEERGQKP